MTGSSQHPIENFLWSIMGPAELGPSGPREGYVADAAAELCDKCGQQWASHQRLHKDTSTYLVCPVAA